MRTDQPKAKTQRHLHFRYSMLELATLNILSNCFHQFLRAVHSKGYVYQNYFQLGFADNIPVYRYSHEVLPKDYQYPYSTTLRNLSNHRAKSLKQKRQKL